MASSGLQGLVGSWDYADGENFDDYMKEIGVGMVSRLAAKGLKPRVVISENGSTWTFRTESSLKTVNLEFTPGVEFNETTPDGREVKTTVNVEGDKIVQNSVDKNGKKSVVTRYIDSNGQLMVEMESGAVKARRWYKRV